jgi:predicted glycosyltransferase
MRVMIVVTHLMGVGHLTRANLLASAFRKAGHRTLLVSGGRTVPSIDAGDADVVQLPALASDGINYKRLLDENGVEAAPALFAARQALLLESFAAFRPDIVLTELFPFGRRQLDGEFMALIDSIDRTKPRPLLLSSIRDVLEPPRKRERAEQAFEIVARAYDGVLVHGAADVVPLSASWPVTPALAARLHYTGYVAHDPVERMGAPAGRAEIIVSSGGSVTGGPLFSAAIDAARLLPAWTWRLLIGGGQSDAALERLRANAPAHVSVERARRDFPELLAGAALSISQCGYNTAVDVLRAGAPAIVVPFEGGGEREQRIRADWLDEQKRAVMLTEAALTGATLADGAQRAMALPAQTGRLSPQVLAPVLQGARRTVEIVRQLWLTRAGQA